MPKDRYERKIDKTPPVNFGAVTAPITSTDSPAPPAYVDIMPPSNVQLTTTIENSAVTPTALIGATWDAPIGYDGVTYIVQYSTDPTFATDYASVPASQESATIFHLKASTLYYVRVQAVVRSLFSDWSDAASITTAADTTPPAAPTFAVGQGATFIGTGDLVVTWTNPTSANFKDVEINIYASNGGTLLATVWDRTERYVWTAAQNLAATGGVGDPTLYVTLRARSYGNVYSASTVNASATKAAPTAPTVTVDFTGRDAVFTITPSSDTAKLSFVADTGVTARILGAVGRYVYPFDQNRIDHSGTPDPVLDYSFTAIDGLNQNSASATTGTATNAAPGAPTVTLTGGFSLIIAQVTSAAAADFAAYEYVWKRDTVTQRTLESAAAEQQYELNSTTGDEGTHSWTVVVRQKDAFGQYSSATTSSAVVTDALTIGFLRSDWNLSDSDSNTFTPPASGTLAALKDGVTTSGGVSYAA